MLTRRALFVSVFFIWSAALTATTRAQQDDMVTVRIRADERAHPVLQPIEEENLTIQTDNSAAAKDLASWVPPGRALPILVIIAGAIAVTELLEMIKELYRQTYYGGVLIDTRLQPPSITSDPRIPASMVFVIGAEGKTNQYTGDQFSVDALKVALKVNELTRNSNITRSRCGPAYCILASTRRRTGSVGPR